MKRIILLLIMMLSFDVSLFAQEVEKAKPMEDTEVVRKVSLLDIEGKTYENVVVTMKSTTPDYFFTDKYKVKVKVESATGKKVWSKTFKSAFLYVFSNGQIQIGQQNFNQIIISKLEYSDDWIGKVREKEGVF